MSGFVLDVSATMAWFVEDEASPATWAIVDRLEDEGALVPALWPLEVVNVRLVAERRNRATAARAGAFIEQLLALPIQVAAAPANALGDLHGLGRPSGLTAYDASYLDPAVRRNLPLATTDRALASAAAVAGVALLPSG